MQYGLFHRLRTRFFAGLVAKKQEKEDNLFRLPSSPVQIYNIFRKQIVLKYPVATFLLSEATLTELSKRDLTGALFAPQIKVSHHEQYSPT